MIRTICTAALIVLALFTGLAHAAPSVVFIEIAGGGASFIPIEKDNYWVQEATGPYNRDTYSPAWRVGVGFKVSPKLAYTVGWLDLGHSRVNSTAVPDAQYNADTHTCSPCDVNRTKLYVESKARGPEFAVTYGRDWYLRGGVFLWLTRLEARWHRVESPAPLKHMAHNVYTESGYLIAPFIGGGFKKGPIFAELTYYHGLGGGGYPIAKSAIVPMLGARVEF